MSDENKIFLVSSAIAILATGTAIYQCMHDDSIGAVIAGASATASLLQAFRAAVIDSAERKYTNYDTKWPQHPCCLRASNHHKRFG